MFKSLFCCWSFPVEHVEHIVLMKSRFAAEGLFSEAFIKLCLAPGGGRSTPPPRAPEFNGLRGWVWDQIVKLCRTSQKWGILWRSWKTSTTEGWSTWSVDSKWFGMIRYDSIIEWCGFPIYLRTLDRYAYSKVSIWWDCSAGKPESWHGDEKISTPDGWYGEM